MAADGTAPIHLLGRCRLRRSARGRYAGSRIRTPRRPPSGNTDPGLRPCARSPRRCRDGRIPGGRYRTATLAEPLARAPDDHLPVDHLPVRKTSRSPRGSGRRNPAPGRLRPRAVCAHRPPSTGDRSPTREPGCRLRRADVVDVNEDSADVAVLGAAGAARRVRSGEKGRRTRVAPCAHRRRAATDRRGYRGSCGYCRQSHRHRSSSGCSDAASTARSAAGYPPVIQRSAAG